MDPPDDEPPPPPPDDEPPPPDEEDDEPLDGVPELVDELVEVDGDGDEDEPLLLDESFFVEP